MPILELATKSDLFSWSKEFASPDRYIAVVTDSHEVILHPRKTSKPIVYTYYKMDLEDVDYILSNLRKAGYNIMHVKNYHWDTERFPSSGVQ